MVGGGERKARPQPSQDKIGKRVRIKCVHIYQLGIITVFFILLSFLNCNTKKIELSCFDFDMVCISVRTNALVPASVK